MVDIILNSLVGLSAFLMYFGGAVGAVIVFSIVYMWVTPHDELALIKENNPAAATAFVGALIGYALPLLSALANSVSLVDFTIWAVVALVVQIVFFILVRKLVFPKISERIERGEVAAAIQLAGMAVVTGILNAGSMTY